MTGNASGAVLAGLAFDVSVDWSRTTNGNLSQVIDVITSRARMARVLFVFKALKQRIQPWHDALVRCREFFSHLRIETFAKARLL